MGGMNVYLCVLGLYEKLSLFSQTNLHTSFVAYRLLVASYPRVQRWSPASTSPTSVYFKVSTAYLYNTAPIAYLLDLPATESCFLFMYNPSDFTPLNGLVPCDQVSSKRF